MLMIQMMNWWANKTKEEKIVLAGKYFYNCPIESITIDDIELIYNKENNQA